MYGIGLEFALIESAVWIMSTFDTHEKVSIKRDSELQQMNREIELEVIYRGNSRFSKRNNRIHMKEMKGWVSNSGGDKVGRGVNNHCARSRGNRKWSYCYLLLHFIPSDSIQRRYTIILFLESS